MCVMLRSLTVDVREGLCCAVCAVYFERAHGYPVACESCHAYERQELPGEAPWYSMAVEKGLQRPRT